MYFISVCQYFTNILIIFALHIAIENDSKISNLQQENHENEEAADSLDEPSECKIAKTETEEAKIPTDSEIIEVKIIYNKNKYDVKAPIDSKVSDFKKQLQELLGMYYCFVPVL